MRILHTADWHLGKSLYDFSLLDDQAHMIERFLEMLQSQRIDAVIIAGDLYDRPVPSAGAVQLYDHFLSQAVGRLGIPVLAIAGNHDSASRLEFGSSLYSSSGYYIAGQPRKELRPVALPGPGGPVRFWLIPYLQPAELRPLFPGIPCRSFDDAYRILLEHNRDAIDPAGINIAVAHGFFSAIGEREDKELLTSDSEINVGGIDIADISHFSPFDYTALGHLHAPQRVGGEHARYGGSPLKYSLSEERQNKSYTLLEWHGKGKVEISPLPIAPLRDVRTIRGTLEQLLDPSFHVNPQFDDYAFAELLGGDVLYPMEKLRKLFPHLLGLRVMGDSDDTMPEIRLGGSLPRLSPEDMFLRFYREAKGHDMPEDAAAFLRETLEQAKNAAEKEGQV